MNEGGRDQVRDIGEHVGAYMPARMGKMSERARAIARDANSRVAELTGRPIASWPGDAKPLVRDHPLGAIAITIGLGYVVGKRFTNTRMR